MRTIDLREQGRPLRMRQVCTLCGRRPGYGTLEHCGDCVVWIAQHAVEITAGIAVAQFFLRAFSPWKAYGCSVPVTDGPFEGYSFHFHTAVRPDAVFVFVEPRVPLEVELCPSYARVGWFCPSCLRKSCPGPLECERQDRREWRHKADDERRQR